MSTLAPSIQATPIKSSIPSVIEHPSFAPGTTLRSQAIQAIIEKHRKVLIFTGPVMRASIAHEARKGGSPVTTLMGVKQTTDDIEALEAFDKAEEGVLLVNPYSETGWRVDAKCIVLCELLMPRSTADLFQMVTRARAAELHLINCRFSPSVVTELARFFEGSNIYTTPIDSEPTTQI
jgi:hypothetical protein